VEALHPDLASDDAGNELAVLVAIDSEVSRRGLTMMLESLSTVSEVTGCGSVAQAIPTLQRRPNIKILITSPSEDCAPLGAAANAELRNRVNVLFLVREADRSQLDQFGGYPVDGFLLESDLTVESLEESLRRLADGEMPLPAPLARDLLRRVRTPTRSRSHPISLLTPREQLTLTLLVEGLSNKQIARRIGISEHGAKRHVANVLAKLNCPNRTLAVAVALREGIVAAIGDPTNGTTRPVPGGGPLARPPL
jgi:DNA-binding NarL/FixJ family response regulator